MWRVAGIFLTSHSFYLIETDHIRSGAQEASYPKNTGRPSTEKGWDENFRINVYLV